MGGRHTHVHLETGEGRDVVIHMYTWRRGREGTLSYTCTPQWRQGREGTLSYTCVYTWRRRKEGMLSYTCVHLETEEGRDDVIHMYTWRRGREGTLPYTCVHLETEEGRDVAIHMCTPGDGGGKGRCHTHVHTWRRGREGTLPYTCVHLETGEGRDVVSVASACVHPERGGVEVGVGASVIEIIYVDEGMEGGVVPVSQKYITYV